MLAVKTLVIATLAMAVQGAITALKTPETAGKHYMGFGGGVGLGYGGYPDLNQGMMPPYYNNPYGYQQQGYPPGFQQQGFPNYPYQQQGFPLQGFPQQGFQQMGFPQQGFPQQGFPQPGTGFISNSADKPAGVSAAPA